MSKGVHFTESPVESYCVDTIRNKLRDHALRFGEIDCVLRLDLVCPWQRWGGGIGHNAAHVFPGYFWTFTHLLSP
jgi:hypothetical protein